jgi:EAL domain-containing protein (putative c-di-GMP-specific phosphodiesterase class I)
MGIGITMDDFGTGYSSLSMLKRFPVDTIKIDGSFITDIASDPSNLELVRTIISMGHSLHRRVVAEGVESDEQARLLRELDCDEMQGYLASAPISSEELLRLLTTTRQAAQA